MSLEEHIEKLKKCEKLKENAVKDLCLRFKEMITKENNVIAVSSPITVCGDIHGQLPDLLELFKVTGNIPYNTYLFLGDYVDRGFHSVETYLLLIALKVKYPTRLHLIRGNHESKDITQIYGFYDECLKKYGSITVWRYCLETFNVLPVAALVDGKVLCIHGGLSPNVNTLDDIRGIDRFQEVPHQGGMCDLLWSDPEDSMSGWGVSPRGAGYLFGDDVVDKFNRQNSVEFIARAHQLVFEGFKWHFKQKLVTVWSAPNYCYRCRNVASVMELGIDQESFTIFEAAPELARIEITKKPEGKENFL